MTDPKALTDEQIDEAFYIECNVESTNASRLWYVDGATLNKGDVRKFAREIERATREQTASTGAPHRLHMDSYDVTTGERFAAPEQPTLQDVELFVGTLVARGDGWSKGCAKLIGQLWKARAAPVEQAGSPPLVHSAQPSGEEKT